ncbi:hypothetical protein B0H12DRAFT_1328214 [Mycena haematopus]|nr:hypothetical protein B0H12DRAFT_1328214 [Mycena haematopus]
MSSLIPYPRYLLSTSTASPIPGRKCWKKTKERTGPIWSPLLEAALIEGLDTPASVAHAKRDHLTPKQVGSRLQQMRDVCRDERILDLIFRPDFSRELVKESVTGPNTPSESSVSSDDCSSTSDTPDAVDGLSPNTFITIELVQPSHFVHQQITRSPRTNHCCVSLEYPSDIETNDPILAFSTPRKISTAHHFSYFRVLIGGVLVHSEVTELTFVSTSSASSPVDTEQHTYSAKLIPLYWAHLCRTAQLFQCVIEQDIMKTLAQFDTLPTSPSPSDKSIRSITYEFSVTRTAAPALLPPPLASEPSLPPEFPAIGYTSRTPAQKTSRGHTTSFSPFYTPPLFYAPDGSFVAPTQDGLFSGTYFQDAIPASSTLPYVPCSTLYDYDDTHCPSISPYEPSDPNQWPSTYNPSTSIWSEYLELIQVNSNSV